MTSRHRTNHTVRVLALVAACAVLAPALAGCGDDDGSGACEANLLPGDLVITEVMPNPEGADEGQEWFEVYNATSASIDLRGVTLVYSRADGTSRRLHVIESASIGPNEYMVFGGILPVAMPPYMDYAYGDDLGSLTNTGGRLAIECNETLVDDVVYLEATSGASLSYDGANAPDAIGNDTFSEWCDSVTPFDTDALGTPGAANDHCGGGGDGTCNDGGVERDVVPPVAGDVVITEFMPNPDVAADADGEWFEVYFASAADLNGLQLGEVPGTVEYTVDDATCLPVAAGTYVLFAVERSSALNGGLPPVDVVFDGFTLSNSGGEIFVGYADAVLDHISYSGSAQGASTQLDPAQLDPTANDNPDNWCDATSPYGGGDLGTPGAANVDCNTVLPDTCLDNGTPRSIVPPAAGDVVISEFMANPAAVNDTEGEWFEVYFAANADLNGLEIGDVGNPDAVTVTSADCIPITAGSYVVFARNADNATNGGITVVDYEANFALNNTSADSISVGYDGTVLDQITFNGVSAGASMSLSATALDPTANDDPGAWCDGVAPYGDGDLGTPGSANPSCS